MKNFFEKINLILDKDHKRKTKIIISVIIGTTVLEILGISLVIPIFAIIFENNNLSKYFIFNNYFNNLEKQTLILTIICLVLIIYLMKNLLLSFFTIYQSRFIWGVKKDLAEKILNRYLSTDKKFIEKKNSSILLNILTKEISYFVHLLFSSLIFVSETLILSSVIIIMIFFETKIFISLLFFIMIYYIILLIFTKKKIKILGNKRIFFDTSYLKYSSQVIEGVREIKIYNQSDYFIKKFNNTTNEVYNINWKLEMFQNIPRFWLEYLILTFVLILVLILNKSSSSDNIMLIIGLLAIAGARLLPSINRMYQSFQSIKIYFPCIDAIAIELNKKTEEIFLEGKKRDFKFVDKIEFKNLNFDYQNYKVFENFRFNIEKNSLIGIYGPNGSGKSTMLDLMFGFIKPKRGEILVDGFDIQQNLSNWQKKISYIPQKIFLTDSTILENITFTENLDKIDEKFFNDILKKSTLNEVINKLPNGIHTNVGERGSKLSGGQQQRIGLARALFKKPEILVMDESISSIDNYNANKIISTINSMNDITRIIVSHNLEILENCDKVFRLSDGKIKEMKI